MKRLFLLTMLVCYLPAGLYAQKHVKTHDELQQLLNDAGLTAEVRKESVRIAIPESKWELYAYLTGRGSKVWLSFTCQPLPKDAPAEKLRELMESNDDGISGCYFSVNPKSKNIYINLMLENRALTGDVLREKVNTVADFAIKHAKIWDPVNWDTSTPKISSSAPIPSQPDMPKLIGDWNITVEEKKLMMTGSIQFFNDGKFIMKLADEGSNQPARTVEGEWKLERQMLLITSKAGKRNTFQLIASITGSKTEYQFQGQDQGQEKIILSR